MLGQALRSLGRNDEADAAYRSVVKLVEQHVNLNPDDARAWILGATASTNLADSERAIQYAERAIAVDPEDPMLLYNVACTYGVLGKTEECLGALEQAVSKGWGDRSWLEHDSDMDSVRDTPKSKAIIQAM